MGSKTKRCEPVAHLRRGFAPLELSRFLWEFVSMSQAPAPRLRIELFDNATVASFVDERIVDDIVIQSVGEQLYNLVERDGHKRLLLNFSNVKFMASAVIAKLFTLHKKVQQAKGKLKFCCIDPDLRVVFKITGLERIVEIYDDEQDALDSF
jgi:anti-sigma B factor antagonist